MTRYNLAIFGNPLTHTKSPKMHNEALKYCNFEGDYIKCELVSLANLKNIFIEKNLNGANVTMPFKEDAFMQCDEVVGIANEIKAVNTLVFQNNKLIGYNTDAIGFLKSIEFYHEIKTALILGSGSTAKSIYFALKQKNIDIDILSRNKNKNSFLTNCYSFENFKTKPYDIIINTTPAGLYNDFLPIPSDLLEKLFTFSKIAYDVLYGKPTPFLNLAQKFNLQTKNGLDMLLFQGVFAFELFTNIKADDALIDTMKRSLI